MTAVATVFRMAVGIEPAQKRPDALSKTLFLDEIPTLRDFFVQLFQKIRS